MKRAPAFVLLFAGILGCGGDHRLRTDSFIRLAPAKMRISADPIAMEPQVLRDRAPLATMPVQRGNTGCIAMVDVDGLLVNQNQSGLGSMGENPIDLFREKLDLVERNRGIGAVIVRINSFGGGVTASDIMRRELLAFKTRTGIPVVAVLMEVSTGGAYLLATAADRIVAHPTTLIGGFGVILNTYQLDQLMDQFNIAAQNIKSGKMIDIGSPERLMDEDEEALLKSIADEYADRFKNMILASRASLDSEAEIFDGRVFTAMKGSELGLVDSIGYIDDAIAEARGFVGDMDAGVVMLHRPQDKARTPYATTPNQPFQAVAFPSIPGLTRASLPTFLYMWQPDPDIAK